MWRGRGGEAKEEGTCGSRRIFLRYRVTLRWEEGQMDSMA